ncbi:uncharacterized protein METZ01_LOCUS191541, partial [marine metagenome]
MRFVSRFLSLLAIFGHMTTHRLGIVMHGVTGRMGGT